LCLIDGIIETVPTVFQTVATELQVLIDPKYQIKRENVS